MDSPFRERGEMKLLLFILVIGVVNCTTLFFKPDIRVSPICDFGSDKIKNLDFTLTKTKNYPSNSINDKLKKKIKEYEIIKNEMININIISEDISKILLSTQDRIDAIQITLVGIAEKEGDIYVGQYNFPKAIESYLESLHQLGLVDEKNKISIPIMDRLQKKIQITKENGENFLNNRIKSLIDQAIFLNLNDQVSKAKEAMRQAEKELETSLFTNPKIISLYSEQAKVMNFYDNEIEINCSTKLTETMINQNKKILPENFITKAGIKFTKILRKDGKPVFVSDVIRSDKEDSWYFVRDYAAKLNMEENCNDCYHLPEFADIENVKANGNNEGLWLKSWTSAPFGMTAGNFFFFFYTFDFFHDVIAHPFTWQSYIYPISPDSVYFSDGSWTNDARIIRSASRISYLKGFRLVRPL